MTARRGEGGFTLLEMLLAMTLLSLLLVALFGGLRFMGRGSERVETALEDSQRLDLLRDLLSRQTANLFPLATAGESGGKLLFTGRPDRLAFPILRLPGQGPAGLMLAVFDIVRSDGVNRLLYREYPFLEGAVVAVADNPTRSTQLVESRAPMEFRYRGKSLEWQEQWSEPASLPQLIAFSHAPWPVLLARPHADGPAP